MITATKALKGINKCLTLKNFRKGHGMNSIRDLSDWIYHTEYICLVQRKYKKYEDIYIKELFSEKEIFEGDELLSDDSEFKI
jgi:hypothetical protein